MENSAFEAIYTGVYIFVFIAAFTITLYLFMSINELANKAYDYGNIATGQAVIEVGNTEDELYMSNSEVISFVFNYKVKDIYADSAIEEKCNVVVKSAAGLLINFDTDDSYDDVYNKLKASNKYLFKYVSEDAYGIPTIHLEQK